MGTVRSRLSREKRLLEILGPGYVEGSAPDDPERDIYALMEEAAMTIIGLPMRNNIYRWNIAHRSSAY